MADLDIDQPWAANASPTEANIDNLIDDTETYVNTTKLEDGNFKAAGITASDKFVDLSVTGGKLADSAVTRAKQPARNIANGSDISSTLHFTTSYSDVTDATLSITTTGRPVLVWFQTNTTALTVEESEIVVDTSGSTNPANIKLLRDSTDLAEWTLQTDTGQAFHGVVSSSIMFLDEPSAGTYTYKFQSKIDTTPGDTLTFTNMTLYAMEI